MNNENENKERVNRLAARWVERYSWDKNLRAMPMIAVELELKKYKSKEPIKLYRFERKDHIPYKRETNKNIPLQSWSKNKKMVEDIAEMENMDLKEPLYIVKEKVFNPHEIYTDFTLLPQSIKKYYKSGESEMDEVLVYHYANESRDKKYYEVGGWVKCNNCGK